MKKVFVSLLAVLSITGACSNHEDAAAPKDRKNGEAVKVEVIDKELKVQFGALGEVPVPEDNPMTEGKIELGKMLYFDPRLSGNNVQSCISCHAPGAGFGDGMEKFIGFEGVHGSRNSQTIINAGYYEEYFWDGRAKSLEEQALGPIQSKVEMNQNIDELVMELNNVPTYVEEFNKVFNDKISADNIAKAIATFERTIVITDTAFDRYLQGEENAISLEARDGMRLFAGKAGCISCHAGPLLSDSRFHNLGINGDEGRFTVSGNEADKGRFRTPALRGVAHTAPFMHDGSMETLKDVVQFYNVGGGSHSNKSKLMKRLHLTDREVDALVAFLESLGGEPPQVEAPKDLKYLN
ncbi:c-type cytochrome [Brevibacillus sp. M2.1A]|uniref:cytochrome-c peroxidase n=1 Tax=Brevibacillus sp. M2.1A TaxID=2738980 RepID=UPI00156B46F3|nr:cytochrome c peroxidase [Brevibacillus sp. M2.1A]MCC8438529.1 c-type cytochrome [Brevibacillus sp. M2.1A]